MKLYATLTFLLAALSGCATQSPPPTVPVQQLEANATKIIGRLGKPLGTIMEIEAVVVSVPRLPLMGAGFGAEYGLRVETIHGQPLAEPPIVRFQVHGTLMIKLAPNRMAFERLLHRLTLKDQFDALPSRGGVGTTEPLSVSEVAALLEHYLGSKHKLLVYETGAFDGAPPNIPPDFGFVFLPIPHFGFTSEIVVFAEL